MLHKPPRPQSARASLRRSSSSGCKLERVAGWVSAGLYAAFFTSLDRCSCVKLDTIDMQEPSMRRRDQPLLQKKPKPSLPPLKKLTSPTQHPLEDDPPSA